MATLFKQYQRYCHEYMRLFGVKRVDLNAVAEWMIDAGYWKPEKAFLVRQCKDKLADALRQEYFTDSKGRKARAMHPVVEATRGEQTTLWEDLREMPRKRAIISFQQRRKMIVSDCCRLKTDIEVYNDNYNDGPAIQLSLDFTNDVRESEALSSGGKPSATGSQRLSRESRTTASASSPQPSPPRL